MAWPGQLSWPRPPGCLLVAAVAPLAVGVGATWYWVYGERSWLPPELAGGVAPVEQLSARGPGGFLPILGSELALLGGFIVASLVAGWLGKQLLTKSGRQVATAAASAGALAGIAALLTKGCVAYAAWHPGSEPWRGIADFARYAQGSAFVMTVLLAFSVPVAAVVVGIVVFRVMRADRGPVPTGGIEPGSAESTGGGDPHGSTVWAENWCLPSTRREKPCKVGVCVSGGGIRSAAFSLGALQVLQESGELAKADYLVAVSGGGYAAGAMQLALQPAPLGKEWSSVAGPRDVFGSGSSEFDHVRRHSKYLADGTAEWLRALGVVLRGFIVAQVLLLCTVILLGRATGEIYKAIPVLAEPFRHLTDNPPDRALRFPASAITGAMIAIFVLATVVWLVGVMAENSRRLSEGMWVARARAAGRYLALLGLGMLVMAVVVPLLVRLSADLLRVLSPVQAAGPASSKAQATVQTTAAGAMTVATAGYLAAVAGIFLAVGRLARPAIGWVWSRRASLRALPTVVLQWLLVVFGVIVLIVAHLYVFTRIVADTQRSTWALNGNWPGGPWRNWVFLLVLGILILFGCLVDQTRWSLHPFYRRRLMTAFAVRRVRHDIGRPKPEQYDYEEPTPLSTYCTKVSGFPQVVFLAAANVSGQDLAPPGRRAVPYTLSGDWVGSPRLGWVPTALMEQQTKYPVRMDLTTQAAMAISGAAFASAMGASAAPFSLLFAMTNARLGTWLPNPRFLYRQQESLSRNAAPAPGTYARLGKWLPDPGYLYRQQEGPSRSAPQPGLPSQRRLTYLIREIFGIYPSDGRMLLVTDGGHYENLGLVELLRHAPEKAYCFDASGGENLATSALGPAITLAYEELGIKVSFRTTATDGICDGPEWLMPGSADGDPAAARLKGRLARSCVLVADIEYPDLSLLGGRTKGTLYFARAALTPDSPWPVLAYATGHPSFPNDRTSDQWFDHTQFDAYHMLGRHVAHKAMTAAGIPHP